MEKDYKNSETGCCPRFSPEGWDKKEISWQEKLFVKDRVKSIFHIPVNFGQVMKRNMEIINKESALSTDPIVLSDENSLWGSDLFISVDKEIPEVQMQKISGTFLSRVFEGPYKDMGKWVKEMNEYVSSQEKEMNKMYFYYTTCPKCAKVFGKNYVVILAKIEK
ncbi:hydrolase [Elusimicrobiota bacterium]